MIELKNGNIILQKGDKVRKHCYRKRKKQKGASWVPGYDSPSTEFKNAYRKFRAGYKKIPKSKKNKI